MESPAAPDSGWAESVIRFGETNLPANWTGSGWFRIRIKKSATNPVTTWSLYINQDGASEIFFDGQKVAALGKIGNSRETTVPKRDPFLSIPLAITDTLPHLLAIRYSNYHHYFKNFVGFQAWIGDLQAMNSKQKADQRFFDYLLMSGSAMLILVLLHLLLYFFYPKQKTNLYYSLFVTGTALTLFIRYEAVVTRDPGMQLLLYKLFSVCISIMPLLFALLLYHLSGKKMPALRLSVIACVTVLFSVFYFIGEQNLLAINSISGSLNNVFMLLVLIDGLWLVYKSIRQGNKRLWLIWIGIFITVISSILVGANIFLFFSFRQVMTGMAIICLVMPVAFSIYIAMEVASTNRLLEKQLDENKRLANDNLAKEIEKTKLISEQAEQLEKTVLQRTAQVREQAAKLQEMDAAKSRFFVNLTHEFKTPLTLIINPAKELLDENDKETIRAHAGFILQNSERLLQLINQLLDLSRLENGQMTLHYQNIDLVNWLQVFVGQFTSLADYKRCRISFAPEMDTMLVKTDIDKLEKIVQNLVTNAIKFNKPEGLVEVWLSSGQQDSIEIGVRDNGIGIAAEKLPYIFDRFYQADLSDNRTREGTGIGLALVKELTSLMNGSVEVSSEETRGTCFVIRLPYLNAESPVEADAVLLQVSQSINSIPLTKTGNDISRNETILIVEDNDQLRGFMEITLRDQFHIILAANGSEGIDMALDQIPDLIITDLMMPGKNGYELCAALKQDERSSHIPIIMLTAKTDQASRIEGISIGADAYLAKPFDKTELLAQIGNLIRTRKQLREKYSKENRWLTDRSSLPSIEQDFLDRVYGAIDRRLDDVGFSAEELGREINLGRTQLHRKLKGLIDQGPGDLIRTVRMQRAHDLLEKKVATVAEVSYMVGYGNPANFSTSFARHFGYPPSETGKLSRSKQP